MSEEQQKYKTRVSATFDQVFDLLKKHCYDKWIENSEKGNPLNMSFDRMIQRQAEESVEKFQEYLEWKQHPSPERRDLVQREIADEVLFSAFQLAHVEGITHMERK